MRKVVPNSRDLMLEAREKAAQGGGLAVMNEALVLAILALAKVLKEGQGR